MLTNAMSCAQTLGPLGIRVGIGGPLLFLIISVYFWFVLPISRIGTAL